MLLHCLDVVNENPCISANKECVDAVKGGIQVDNRTTSSDKHTPEAAEDTIGILAGNGEIVGKWIHFDHMNLNIDHLCIII